MNKTTNSGSAKAPFKISEGYDELGHRYLQLLVKGKPVLFRASKVGKEAFFDALIDQGANLFSTKSRNILLMNLEQIQGLEPTFQVATRVGWKGGVFVLPEKQYGRGGKKVKVAFDGYDEELIAKYQTRGKLSEWQKKIAVLCDGNSRLMFSVALALTGPVLRFGGPKTGGFQLVGPAESGKTAAAMVAGSVWGRHRSEVKQELGFVENWNTTKGKAEVTALAHSDTLLILDETKHTTPETVIEAAFALAEGREKERLLTAKSTRSWRCFFLSTSNQTLEELAFSAKLRIDDAYRGRFVDVPLPTSQYGIYEDLRSFVNGAEFTDALKLRSRRYFGTAGRAFVRKLAKAVRTGSRDLRKRLKQERKAYQRKIHAAAPTPPLNRATDRFATVFAAGSLAIRYKIVPWDREELLRAIISCQLDGLTLVEPGAAAIPLSATRMSPRERLVGWLRDHESKFMDLDNAHPNSQSHEFGSVPGYKATFKDEQWLYLTDGQLKQIIGRANAKQMKETLADESLLATQGGKYVVQRPIFEVAAKGNKHFRRVLAIKASIMGAEDV